MTDAVSSADTPRYLRLANDLAAQIRAGQWAPGDAIPPERKIAEQYGVSRVTVRRALELIQAGFLNGHSACASPCRC